MRLSTVAAGAVCGLVALAALPASAQTYGQPYRPPATTYGQGYYGGGYVRYGQGYGSQYGYGGPSEMDPRAYAATGAYADGYSGGHGAGYAYGGYQGPYGYGHGRYGYDRGGRYGYSYPRYDSGRRPGYRDWYGYNDDRPPSGGYGYSSRRYDDGYGRRECGCSDVYLYDR